MFEYLDQDLKNYMDMTGRGPSNPLPKPVVQDFMYQLCLGCAHLHRHGVMHRDLKSPNVLLHGEHGVKIADFGLAAQARDAEAGGRTEVMGTPAYMSPEQARGQSLSPASDVFSFGIILYQLACGRHPFDGGTSWEMAAKILSEAKG